MPGTRTAPAVTGALTDKIVSFHWIDTSSALRADSLHVPVAATNAQIEAYAAALQLDSNASLYKVGMESVWAGVMDAGNAINGTKSSQVQDQLFFTAKHTSPLQIVQRGYIPAPIGANFIGDTDSLDPASTEAAAVITAFLALIGAGYSVVWARYTQTTEINEKTPF